MKIKTTLTLLLILFSLKTFSQKETYNWYFGDKAGLQYHTGVPVAVDTSAMFSHETTSVISDTAGNLMFYSNSEKVWNRNHEIMPNGDSLKGWSGRPLAVVTVPAPGKTNQYYVFHSYPYGTTNGDNTAYYSIVDMNAGNGLGDVIVKNVPVPYGLDTKSMLLMIMHANNKAFWLVLIRSPHTGYDTIYSYLLDEHGLNGNPVKTPTNHYDNGFLKFSPNGKYLFSGGWGGATGNQNNCVIYEFNKANGTFQNILEFDPVPGDDEYYHIEGAEFSANSEYLYCTMWKRSFWPNMDTTTSKIIQYDMSKIGNVTMFEASAFILDETVRIFPQGNAYEHLQMGPDGKIVVATYRFSLGVINFPEKNGFDCGLMFDAISVAPRTSTAGLPNFVQSYFMKFSWKGNCLGDTTRFESWFLPVPDSIHWEFGDPSSGSSNYSNLLNPGHKYSAFGTYTVHATAYFPGGNTQEYTRDVLITTYPAFELGPDKYICEGDQVTINSNAMLVQYHWSTGETTPYIQVSEPGKYWLEVENNNACKASDTISVIEYSPPLLIDSLLIVSPTTCGNATGAIRGLTVNGTQPIALEWKNNAGTVLSNEEDIFNLPVGNYYLWATDGNGCNNLVSQYTISDAGDVLIASVSHLDSYCGQNNGSITITAVSGLSDMLEYSIDNGNTWQNNEGLFEGLAPGPHNVWVKVPDGSGCQAVFTNNPVTIEDFAGPQVDPFSLPATGSNPNGSITLTAAGFGNLTYSLNGGTPQSSGEFTGLIAGTYTWRVEDENGCFAEGSIEVGQEAGFIISAIAGNSAVCLGNAPVAPLLIENFTGVQAFTATLEYDATLVNCEGFRPGSVHPQLEANLIAEVYPASQRIVVTWSVSAPLTLTGTVTVLDLVFSATQAGNSFLTWDQAPAATWFTGEYGSIEPEFQIGQIQVNNPPVFAQQLPINICEGELAWLSATATGNEPLTYQWTLPDGSIVNDPFLIFLNASSANSGQYRVKVSDALGCSDSTMLTLQVTPNPADWFLQDTILFENQYLLAGPAGYASYLWSTGDTLPEITVNTEGLYTLQLTTHNLCAGADSTYLKMLEAESPFLVPNAFTPNSDGLNDTFRPVATSDLIRQFSMVIYNRWGQLIFETTNPEEGWIGKDSPVGVYTWVISYSDMVGKVVKLRGGVTLIK